MRLKLTWKPIHVICAAFTYAKHAKEFGFKGRKMEQVPMLFFKSSDSIIWNNETVILPDLSNWLDTPEPWGWVSGEVELAAVIKNRAYDIEAGEVEKHIMGYTILNDVTQRDLEKAGYEMNLVKSFPTFGPCGPSIVTKDEVKDPQNLKMKMRVNGKVYQDSSTSELNISVFEIVSAASRFAVLNKGDLISTGTPPGCLSYRLKDGDIMEAEIEGIGLLNNPVKFRKP
jgi:2-keto-4-pentenoate hydratase/2-oxohepta-3-ene-1,7-dioic acid hydratase in catechol pathway